MVLLQCFTNGMLTLTLQSSSRRLDLILKSHSFASQPAHICSLCRQWPCNNQALDMYKRAWPVICSDLLQIGTCESETLADTSEGYHRQRSALNGAWKGF